MNPGNANISRNVAVLPHHVTSKRFMPNTNVAMATVPPNDHLADDHRPGEPQRGRTVDDDAADPDDEQQPVGGRVEDLAELTGLIEATGQPAIDPVGGSEAAEQPRCAGAVVATEQQVQEQRDAAQPQQGECVRSGAGTCVSTSCSDRRSASRASLRSCRTMATIFTRIINGEIPGTFVHRDERCVAFMSINPLARGTCWWCRSPRSTTGSTPRPTSSLTCSRSPTAIGSAQQQAFDCERVGRDRRRLRGAACPHPRDPDRSHGPASLRQRGDLGRPRRPGGRCTRSARRCGRAPPSRESLPTWVLNDYSRLNRRR